MFTLLLFSVLAVQTSAAEDAYKTNFDKSASALRTDRYIRTIDFNGGGGTQTININLARPYIDLTADKASEIWCRPGESVAVQMNIQGAWMHGYVYIDLGNDGQFSYNEGSLSQSGTDVMSFSFYSGDFNKSDSGVNSAGETLTGSAVNTMELPGFVAPTTEGTYRIRFKMDWNSVDPAGQVGSDGTAGGTNGILANGGSIVDATLVVSSSAPYNNIAELDNNKSYYIECPLFYNTQGVHKAMYVGEDGDLLWNTLEESNPAFQWIPTVNADGTVVFKNAYSNTYLAKRENSDGSINLDEWFFIESDGTAEVNVNLWNPNDVVSYLNFTIYLPEGFEIIDARAGSRIENSHGVVYTNVSDSEVLFNVAPNEPDENENIGCSSGDIVKLTLKAAKYVIPGNYSLHIAEPRIYTPEGKFFVFDEKVCKFSVPHLNSITEWSQFSNDKIYTIATKRAFLLYDESFPDQICTNTNDRFEVQPNASDPNQQFKIVNENGNYYLFSVGAQKYVGADGLLDEVATTPLNIEKLEDNPYYPWKLCIGSQGINTQVPEQKSSGVIVDWWTFTDNGNSFAIEEVGNSITGWSEFSDGKFYTLRTARAFLLYSESFPNQICCNTGTSVARVTYNAADPNQQFKIINKNGTYYLYSVGAQQFVGANGQYDETATTPLTIQKLDNNALYPWKLGVGDKMFNTQTANQVSTGIRIDTWTATDAGNSFVVEEVDKISTEWSEFSNDKFYTLRTARASLLYDESFPNQICANTGKNFDHVTFNAADPNQQFQIINKDGNYYLYSVGAQKFVGVDGRYDETTITPLTIQKLDDNAHYPWKLGVGNQVLNTQGGGRPGIVINSWTLTDEGNCFAIEEVVTQSARSNKTRSWLKPVEGVLMSEKPVRTRVEPLGNNSFAIMVGDAAIYAYYHNTGNGSGGDIICDTNFEPESTGVSSWIFREVEALQNQVDNQGIEYELNDDGTLTIKGTADGTVRDVVIPSELNGTPVTHIAEGAFKNSDIKSIVIPESVVSVGKGAFEGCTDLVWVDWKSQADADADCFDTPEQHGNLVVFTPQEGDYAGNVVVNGVAETITLVDARPYEAPYDYVAKSITFTKRFAKTTAVGLSGGWEGVVVPFDVEYIQHGERSIAPFGGTRSDDALGCWVAELNDKGEFEMVSTIRADRPVIIAMPNSEEYDDDYNISGDVVFSATDAQIKATSRPDLSPSQTFVLRGTYEAIEEQSKVYTLNDDIYNVLYVGDCMPGAVFVANERDVRPFEAYVFTSNPQRSATLKIGGVRPTGIETLLDIQYAPDAWYTLQGVRLNKKPVQTGFYIHGGKLEFVRQR